MEKTEEILAEEKTEEKTEERTVEEILADEAATEDALQELKTWLFRENIRLMTAEAELTEKQEKFAREKEEFQEEVKDLNRRMSLEQMQIKKGNELVEEKLRIIKDGFQKLDIDRRRMEKEWARLRAEQEFLEERGFYEELAGVSVFFRGVKNPLTLKKRYKDLTKMFHPDNVAGDTEMLQRINREYESLKREYERRYRQA